MNCPHSQTTTVAYLFGEAPEGFDVHLESCAECTRVLEEHRGTVSVVEPWLASQEEPIQLRSRRGWLGVAAGMAVAAGLLLGLQVGGGEVAPVAVRNIDSGLMTAGLVGPFESAIDDEILELEFELALLTID